MAMHLAIEDFIRVIAAATSVAELGGAVDDMTRRMGFVRFALTHHVDILSAPQPTIRLHNYPDDWVDFFDRNRLGVCDPIHRASQVTSVGFEWRNVAALIPLTPGDRRVLAIAREHGLADGFTVPANIPGEAHGSCSFVAAADGALPQDALPLAQLAGAFAFEAARRIWQMRCGSVPPRPGVTDRQRDCLVWVARGKTDWEISRILGVSQETVVQHIKQARERYGVQKRTSLLIRTLFDGTISFADILPR